MRSDCGFLRVRLLRMIFFLKHIEHIGLHRNIVVVYVFWYLPMLAMW